MAAVVGLGGFADQHTQYGSTYVNLVSSGNVGTPPPTSAPTTAAPTSAPIASNSTGYTTPDGVMSVAWNVSSTSITFAIRANVTGWVGIGLNSAGLMYVDGWLGGLALAGRLVLGGVVVVLAGVRSAL